MESGRDTVVFVPAWNEEANLPAVLAELAAVLPEADVLVIDDGSTDATAEVARGLGAIVVSFGENRGLRAGIAAGYREAADRGAWQREEQVGLHRQGGHGISLERSREVPRHEQSAHP